MTWRKSRGKENGELAAYEAILSEAHEALPLAPGSQARALPCVTCDQAAGGSPVYLITVVTSEVCPADGLHLLAGAHIRHASCPRPELIPLVGKLAAILASDPQ